MKFWTLSSVFLLALPPTAVHGFAVAPSTCSLLSHGRSLGAASASSTTTSTRLSMSSSSATTICPEIPLRPRPAYQALEGVQRCLVGYSGGHELNPTYQSIQDHTEAVLVEYDPSRISYEQILQMWSSFGTPYPTKTQYRSALFSLNDHQQEAAQAFVANIEYVDVEPATRFYMAEEYHQNFLKKQGVRF